EALRLQRQDAAAQKAAERERRLQQTAAGKAEAEQLNADLAARVTRLESILCRGLAREAVIDLNAMLRYDEFPPLDLGSDGVAPPRPAWSNYAPEDPGVIAGLFGGKSRHDRQLAAARQAFERDERDYDRAEATRQERARERTSRYEGALRAHQNDVARHNDQVAQLAAGFRNRDRESVQYYLELALSGTLLPGDVPHMSEVAYSPRGEQAVVRFELPPVDVVPMAESYTYVATTATLREKKRSAVQAEQLYRSVVSQITLLYMRDLFESDPMLENVELGGHVHFINRATGQPEYPCLISIAVDRAKYVELNLRSVQPDACLRHLNALVSRHPHLVEPVTPVRDFDLARYSFVESVDVVASLDSRPDLTKMTPTEFEHFVRQLFEASGLEGWTTERTGDDGVDAVVTNRDPMIGGLTIVQAKRYNGVIGVSHIRELVGAMDEKRAGRGILVTTSWFASGCWTKAHENGRVELIDGPRLRYLVKEHLHKDVLVAPPAPRARTWQP
ncbi:MAG TPA: restriction endonuclease, partial [Propionibacteriaceae bacterium]|nr:restriction endonuclease [Propionibacteriaceae bacterium]